MAWISTSVTSGMDDVLPIKEWPGTHWLNESSIPTAIAYGRENDNIGFNKWGPQVDSSMKSCCWTKLLLDRNAAPGPNDDPALLKIVGDGILRVPSFRDAVGVSEDFLHEMLLHLIWVLEKKFPSEYHNIQMECWITLLAIW